MALNDADSLRRARAPFERGDYAPTEHCLDDHTVAALADGSLAAADRAAVLPHIAACVRCRRAVASVARALADPEVAREIRATQAPQTHVRKRVAMIAGAAAAAAVLLLVASPPPANEPLPAHRASPITAAPPPQALMPIGAVAEARRLRWTSVAGADRYRVIVFDAAGGVLYESELTDTIVTLPDSVLPRAGETRWWRVDARLGFDRWAASQLIEFTVLGDTLR